MGTADEENPNLRNKAPPKPKPKANSTGAVDYRKKTPGVHSSRKVEGSAPSPLVRKVQAKAKDLLKERLKGSVLTRIPVYTSLHDRGPFELIRPEQDELSKAKWATIERRHVPDQANMPRLGVFEEQRQNVQKVLEGGNTFWITQKIREGAYALIQLYIYIAYWFSTWFGASIKKPGKWRLLAFRYPPTENGWDFFNIRAECETLTRSNVIFTKKKVWFNPETGRHETVMFTNMDDESYYQDRYPGETDGLDPAEFAKYHYLSPEDTAVKWLGEKIFTPVMTVFVAFVFFLLFVNGAKIVISVGHMFVVEYPDVAWVISSGILLWVIARRVFWRNRT
ncbi:hypothetical protein TWF281_006592 [Arthrobotrys megalospora]